VIDLQMVCHQRYEEPVKKMNLIMDLNIIYNKLYANVSKETVEHEGTLLKFYSNGLR
jgi:hypothetical protein